MGADEEIVGLPLDSAGVKLRRAREAAGKTLADVSAATKIPERLLVEIEAGNFAALPSRTYVVGFTRSYARLVGLDEHAIAREVRGEIDGAHPGDEPATIPAFAPGDPARVPERRLAIIAGLCAAIVIVAGAIFWHVSDSPGGPLPSILPADAPPLAQSGAAKRGDSGAPAGNPTPVSASAAGEAVTFSALAAGTWVKVYDASGKTLLEKQMAQGESFTVPANANGPLIWTARPEALSFMIGGKPVAKLSDTQKTIKGVPISAAALLGRAALPQAPQALPQAPQALPKPAQAANPAPTKASTASQ
jgi:cytoskeleton protein RodZ